MRGHAVLEVECADEHPLLDEGQAQQREDAVLDHVEGWRRTGSGRRRRRAGRVLASVARTSRPYRADPMVQGACRDGAHDRVHLRRRFRRDPGLLGPPDDEETSLGTPRAGLPGRVVSQALGRPGPLSKAPLLRGGRPTRWAELGVVPKGRRIPRLVTWSSSLYLLTGNTRPTPARIAIARWSLGKDAVYVLFARACRWLRGSD
jgi:hypothetical protein